MKKLRKIIGCIMMVYNEDEFLRPAILSVLPFVNQLIIGEGATKITHKITGSWESTDKTIKVIKRIQKEDDVLGKIKVVRGKWENKCHIQNSILKRLSADTNRLLVHGGDEVYKKEEFKLILKYDSEHPKMMCVRYPFIHFWHDLNHIAVGGSWSKYQLRYSKFKKGVCSFKVHYAIGDNNSIRMDGPPYSTQGRVHKFNAPKIYHYGHAKSRKNQMNKFIFYSIRDHKMKDIEKIKNMIKNKSTWWNWKGEIGKKHNILLFTGTHPELMHSHPRYIKEVAE